MSFRHFVQQFARTAVVGGALVLGTGAAAGCAAEVSPAAASSNDAPAATPAKIAQVRRSVHFDLGAMPDGGRYELELGGRTYDLARHTPATLARYTAEVQRGLRAGVMPSHYVSEASFSRQAPQSFEVVRVDADGARTMVLGGVHMPDAQALSSAPLAVDASSAAELIVFRDPTLLTIDGAPGNPVATRVLAHIRAAADFPRLVETLQKWGPETTLDDQAAHHTGWAVTVVSKDGKGRPISATVPGADSAHVLTHWVTAGSPEYYAAGFKDRYELVDGNRVRMTTPFEVLAKVRKQARLAVRDDQELAGKMWVLQKDTTVRALTGSLGAGAAKLDFTVDDTQWKGDRRVSVVASEGRKVTFRVENNAWRRQGVLVRFRDAAGGLIAKKDIKELPESELYGWMNDQLPYSTMVGMVDGRFTVLGVPLAAESKEDFTIELPDNASSFEVNIGSAGTLVGGAPSYVGAEPEPLMSAPGAVDTLLLDVALPILGLTLGAGSEHFTKANPLVRELASVGVQVGTNLLMHYAATDASGVNAFNRDYAVELLTEVIADTPAIAVALLEWAAEVGAEKALEAPLELIATALEAIEVTGTLVGIGETVGTIVDNTPITYNRIAASERLDIVVTPKGESGAPGYFSALAKSARAYVYYGHSTVPTVTAPQRIDPTAKSVSFSLPGQPVGGEIRVKVALESDTGWVAGQGEVETENEPDAQAVKKVAVEVEQNPTPIDGKTHYTHDRVLVLQGGKRAWLSTTQAPTATAPQVCDPSDTSHPWLCGAGSMTFNGAGILGYSWTGSGTELTSCNGATNVQGSVAQSINVNTAVGAPDARLKQSSCGALAPVFVAFDPSGDPATSRHVMVAQVTESRDGRPPAPVYEVFPVDITSAGNLDPNASTSLGHFRSAHLDDVAFDAATGTLLALDRDEQAVEVLKLASAPVPFADAPTSSVVGGQGRSVGRLHGATSLAFLPAGAGFLVLESDRVQAFTFDGASVDMFGKSPAFALRSNGEGATYTDMKVDPTESYVYVSSYVGARPTPADYRLDIYRIADGAFVSRTVGVVGAKIAIDRWRDLYTLNYANLAGATWPEPSVSEWIAPPVDPAAAR